jgi:hypothetical protein
MKIMVRVLSVGLVLGFMSFVTWGIGGGLVNPAIAERSTTAAPVGAGDPPTDPAPPEDAAPTVELVPFSTVTKDSSSALVDFDRQRYDEVVQFANKDLASGWLPWVIKNLSILMGGLSFISFVYAGVNLFLKGDDPEQISHSLKIITYSIIGLVIAAFSYAIVANVLNLF